MTCTFLDIGAEDIELCEDQPLSATSPVAIADSDARIVEHVRAISRDLLFPQSKTSSPCLHRLFLALRQTKDFTDQAAKRWCRNDVRLSDASKGRCPHARALWRADIVFCALLAYRRRKL